jgi:CheY-like chemotaxis protein
MPFAKTETILVVDDEPLVLSLTSAMLTRYGYSVLTAASGAEAIALFKHSPSVEVHLLVVDLAMPDMTGVAAVQRISEWRPSLPVLYFSAYSDDESLRPSYARGIPFLAKPFTSLQLIKKIRELLDGPNPESQTSK